MFWYGNQHIAWVEKLSQENRTSVYVDIMKKKIAIRICFDRTIEGSQDQKNIWLGKR